MLSRTLSISDSRWSWRTILTLTWRPVLRQELRICSLNFKLRTMSYPTWKSKTLKISLSFQNRLLPCFCVLLFHFTASHETVPIFSQELIYMLWFLAFQRNRWIGFWAIKFIPLVPWRTGLPRHKHSITRIGFLLVSCSFPCTRLIQHRAACIYHDHPARGVSSHGLILPPINYNSKRCKIKKSRLLIFKFMRIL